MFINEQPLFSPRTSLSWQLLAIKLILLALLAVVLEKPAGSLSGHISLEMKGFGLNTYDMRQNHVYALVDGPRSGPSVERAVWVRPDGSFKLDHLPVGEYNLRVRAKGFATYEQNGLFVDEGKTTVLPQEIAMSVLNPSVSIGQHSRMFTTAETPRLYVNSTGSFNGRLKIYKIDFLTFIHSPQARKFLNCDGALNIYRNANAKLQNPLSQKSPLVEQEFKLEQDYTDSARATIDLRTKLPAGDYLAYVQVNGINGQADDFTWFNVTDLGLIIKRDTERVIARAINLNTLKPIAHCAITAQSLAADMPLVGPVYTGTDGTAQLPLAGDAGGSNAQIVFVGAFAAQRAYGGLGSVSFDSDSFRTYFYTERPVYRLGQTVCYKGICRQVSGKGFTNPGRDLTLQGAIEDPDNNEIWHGQFKTSAHGSFYGSFVVPPDGKTGAYQLRLTYPDGATSYGSFEIEEYRKPEYQVDLTALTPRVVAGSPAKARLRATYYFGGPVANARVKYSIYVSDDWNSRISLEPRPDYYDYFDQWSSGSFSPTAGEFVCEGYTSTDANGEAIIAFDTKKLAPAANGPLTDESNDKRYAVAAEVTDLSRLTVEGNTSISAVAGNFVMFVQPDSYVVKAGENMNVQVQAENYEGKPVAEQPIDVTVRRWVYDQAKSAYHGDEPLATSKVTTAAAGKAHLSIFIKDACYSDRFYITATSEDREKHRITAEDSVWIASKNYPYRKNESEAEAEPITVRADKDVYKVGDKAKLLITAPLTGSEGADSIVTVEGLRIYDYKVVPMSATAQVVELPITASYAPNVYLCVSLVGKKHQLYTAEQMIKVSPQQKFLNIQVNTDKDRYKPGDIAKYTVTTKYWDGSPAPNTELSLGVVDESIYAIRAEQADDIRRFFYSQRENKVATCCSFPEMYTGGPDKIEPRVRKEFKDTAAWLPDLITDEKGVAVAEVKLPDNLTTWRATVRGIDMNTEVGSCVQKIVSTQDFILRLALPRFFSQGDQGLITAVVHNYTKAPQQVTLNLTTSDQFDVQAAKSQKISVDPDQASRFSWRVSITKSGIATVSAKAIGQTAGDALETKLPIRPLGVPAFTIRTGLLTAAKTSIDIPIGLSADADQQTAKGQITLASSTIGPVLGNFDKLIDYPYGCTEQTMSRLIPSVVAMQLHQQLAIPISAENTKKFAAVQKAALQALNGYHHSDGGWGWWATDASEPYLTSYVVQGLSMLKVSGFVVDNQEIESGLRWLGKSSIALQKQLSDPKLKPSPLLINERKTDLARMLYTLSLWDASPESLIEASAKKGKLTFTCTKDIFAPTLNSKSAGARTSPVRSWLLANASNLAPEALSYLTLTCAKLNDKDGAALAYKQLCRLANTTDYVNWDHTRELVRKLVDADEAEYDYRFTGVETTALALKSVLTMEPNNQDKIESIKQWLLLQRDNNGWTNTKTTAEVFLVLLQEELQYRTAGKTSFRVVARDQAKQLLSAIFDLASSYQPELVVPIPLSPVSVPGGASSPTKLTLSKDGPGGLYYTSLLTYFRHLMPGDQVAAKGLPDGLKIARKFYRLKPTATTADGAVHFKSEEIADGRVKVGETIMMKVFVEAPVGLPYVKVEAALPSGAEVVEDGREASTDTDQDRAKLQGDWSLPWWTHQDVLDDRIVYFGAVLKPGKSEFHTMLRLELPGTLDINPVSLEGMYSDKIKGYSALDRLQVIE